MDGAFLAGDSARITQSPNWQGLDSYTRCIIQKTLDLIMIAEWNSKFMGEQIAKSVIPRGLKQSWLTWLMNHHYHITHLFLSLVSNQNNYRILSTEHPSWISAAQYLRTKMGTVTLTPSKGLHHLNRWAISPSSDHPGLTKLSTSMVVS
ncbi:hypothetical protein CY34DRAFT_539899 [Suillus luteus UH-Slu-Lm8-n1]|uniref:Uncharacterized protein n=1 Tax=Suillus luteus UH-Slu-Lm8-n1 TaxID=930992 RepID=A0A0D0AUG2_9AGAM|nr:hypothetical protein CY34DRAFT_539899 [Suillus luteus UH-Slu-Lm8-n1]